MVKMHCGHNGPHVANGLFPLAKLIEAKYILLGLRQYEGKYDKSLTTLEEYEDTPTVEVVL